jgi:hypothetical protein
LYRYTILLGLLMLILLLSFLHHVYVGRVADVSELHATSIFMALKLDAA